MTSFSVTNQAKRSVWQNTNVPVLGTWESSKKKLKLTDIFRFWKKNTDFTITQVSYAMAEEGTKPSAPLWIEVLHQSKALQTISDHFWCLTLPGFSACSGCHCFVKPETLASNFYPSTPSTSKYLSYSGQYNSCLFPSSQTHRTPSFPSKFHFPPEITQKSDKNPLTVEGNLQLLICW